MVEKTKLEEFNEKFQEFLLEEKLLNLWKELEGLFSFTLSYRQGWNDSNYYDDFSLSLVKISDEKTLLKKLKKMFADRSWVMRGYSPESEGSLGSYLENSDFKYEYMDNFVSVYLAEKLKKEKDLTFVRPSCGVDEAELVLSHNISRLIDEYFPSKNN